MAWIYYRNAQVLWTSAALAVAQLAATTQSHAAEPRSAPTTVLVTARSDAPPEGLPRPLPPIEGGSQGHQEALSTPVGSPGPVAPSRLSLADFQSLAMQRNPTLARSQSRIDAARGEWLQVGLRPNPRIGYEGGEIGNEGRSGMQGGFISQEIVTADKLGRNRNVASREIDRLQQEFAAQQRRVATDVRRSFYDVLAAQRAMDLTNELSQIGERAYQTSINLEKTGNISKVDVLQSRIEAQQAKIMLENSRNRHASAWQQLAAIVGDPFMPTATLAGDLEAGVPELTWEQLRQRFRSESPEIAVAVAAVAKAQAELSRACANRYPNWDVQAGAQYDNATRYTVANVQLSTPIPIYNRNQGAIRQAQAQVGAAQSEVARVELNLQQRLARSFEIYRNARVQTQSYSKQILPDAKQSLDIAVKSYQAGQIGFLSLLNVQRTYFQTQISYLESLRQLRDSTESIDGLLLMDSLQSDK